MAWLRTLAHVAPCHGPAPGTVEGSVVVNTGQRDAPSGLRTGRGMQSAPADPAGGEPVPGLSLGGASAHRPAFALIAQARRHRPSELLDSHVVARHVAGLPSPREVAGVQDREVYLANGHNNVASPGLGVAAEAPRPLARRRAGRNVDRLLPRPAAGLRRCARDGDELRLQGWIKLPTAEPALEFAEPAHRHALTGLGAHAAFVRSLLCPGWKATAKTADPDTTVPMAVPSPASCWIVT